MRNRHLPCVLLCVLSLVVPNFVTASRDVRSDLTHRLSHTTLSVRASSFAAASDPGSNAFHLRDAVVAAAAFSSASLDEELELASRMFHKTKFSPHRSYKYESAASASSSMRRLGANSDDSQFFVSFSTRCDIRTLVALQKFSGHRIIALVDSNLFLAIGGSDFKAKALRFPGVAWVQEREALSKLGSNLQQVLRANKASARAEVGDLGLTEIVAECWYDGCEAAAAAVRSLCPDVYVHSALLEVHCAADSLKLSVETLARHVGVDHIDLKLVAVPANFGGRAIVGTGPNASSPEASRVLSEIDVSGSIIAVADSGIDMNNCFFHDKDHHSQPWNGSRVVHSYVAPSCEACGRCCGNQSGPNCSNAVNACGNFIDQDSHGTHVAGIVAGAGPANMSYGNGISSGSKIFFQDIENIISDDLCYRFNTSLCRSYAAPTDLLNLFMPAFKAGARVHSNSWGNRGSYNFNSKAVDTFTWDNPSSVVLFAAGNDGLETTLGSVTGIASCKNCLSVGASQQSDVLLRSMQPFVDDGFYCDLLGSYAQTYSPCCTDPLSCVNSCCNVTSLLRMSLPCCSRQTDCNNQSSCSVESGNLRSATNVWSISSRGPATDGRFKPDLVVPGEFILSAATPQQRDPKTFRYTTPDHCSVPSQTGPRTPQENFDRALKVQSGSSMSTPLMAGAVEKIRQYFLQGYYPAGVRGSGVSFEPAEALVRAVVLASCTSVISDPSWAVWSKQAPVTVGFFRYLITPAIAPNFFQGFGLPVLDNSVYMANSTSGHRMFFVNGAHLPGSSAATYNVSCDSNQDIPVTIALVWTDPPSSLSSMKQIVNDLDLIVLVPGGIPSQFFGNMRSFADQTNTVERVVTRCPAAGVLTAIVALGDSLKTPSQNWFLVANGPLTSELAPALPQPYNRGRFNGPVTQLQSCASSPNLYASVKFKPSSVWACTGLQSAWDCSVKKQEFVTSLAQVVGVAVQAFGATSVNSVGISMALQCNVMLNSWQSGNETSASLKYVTPAVVFSSIKNTTTATYETDSMLNAFDWSTFALELPPVPRYTISVTAYTDSTCSNMTANFLSGPNPFVYDDLRCVQSPVSAFLRAVSCSKDSFISQVSFTPITCDPSIQVTDYKNCSEIIPGLWARGDCVAGPLPPPASPYGPADSSAVASSSVANWVIITSAAVSAFVRKAALSLIFFIIARILF